MDVNYKLDIRDWKERDRKINPELTMKINDTCRRFTLMHYNQLVMTTAQFKHLAKVWGFVEFDENETKNRFYKTDKGYIMEVLVNDK